MNKTIDITGQKFGDLEVVCNSGRKAKNGDLYWIVRCTCGNIKDVLGGHLRYGKTKTCGCKLRKSKYDYLIGTTVGTYTVIERDRSPSKLCRATKYICKCNCGKTTSIPAITLANSNIKTCVDCMRSERHPAWKGGASSEYNRYTSPKEYREFREAVIQRYGGFRCIKCECKYTRKNRLEIHHIFSYVGYPELVSEPDNATILCRECHKHFHSIYGKGGNTANQLQEFLNIKQTDYCEFVPVKKEELP